MNDAIICVLFGLLYFGVVTIGLFIIAVRRYKKGEYKEWAKAHNVAQFMLVITILYCLLSAAILATLKLIRG